MAVPRVYVRRGTTVWSVTHIRLTDIRHQTQDALTLIFLYLYTIGPKGAITDRFITTRNSINRVIKAMSVAACAKVQLTIAPPSPS